MSEAQSDFESTTITLPAMPGLHRDGDMIVSLDTGAVYPIDSINRYLLLGKLIKSFEIVPPTRSDEKSALMQIITASLILTGVLKTPIIQEPEAEGAETKEGEDEAEVATSNTVDTVVLHTPYEIEIYRRPFAMAPSKAWARMSQQQETKEIILTALKSAREALAKLESLATPELATLSELDGPDTTNPAPTANVVESNLRQTFDQHISSINAELANWSTPIVKTTSIDFLREHLNEDGIDTTILDGAATELLNSVVKQYPNGGGV